MVTWLRPIAHDQCVGIVIPPPIRREKLSLIINELESECLLIQYVHVHK